MAEVRILRTSDYVVLYLLLALVYGIGLFIPLMENDAAQHAVTAMRMYLDQDYLHLIKDGSDYLDKPHLHFWLSSWSYELLGISNFAYRLPALLFTILAGYATYGLAKELYDTSIAHPAALIFFSAQAIFLAAHDVRTDAVLTGSIIFAIWQLVLYINRESLKHAILGALGLALAFSVKGQLGVFIVGVSVLVHLLCTKKFKVVWSYKILVAILVFVIGISPVLYAYYVQFDMHPEKIINNQKGVSGVRFILWDQSFNRLTAKGFEETSPDYFFFFHTLLWAFLPWSVLAYYALFSRLKQLFNLKSRGIKNFESITSVGVLIVLVIISFSQFKLPHYLNGLMPLLAVLVAGFLYYLHKNEYFKTLRILKNLQLVLLLLASFLIALICFWSYPMPHLVIVVAMIALGVGIYYIINKEMLVYRKLIVFSVYTMVFINFCLNAHFYPNLLLYQSGTTAARIIQEEHIHLEKIYRIDQRPSWSLDFYTKQITPKVSLNTIQDLPSDSWVFLYADALEELEKKGFNAATRYELYHFRITRLSLKFLNPNTREGVLEKSYLIKTP